MTFQLLLVFFWAAIAVLSLKNGYTSHFMRGLVNFPPFPRFSVFLYAKVPIQAYVRTLASPKCSSFPPQEVRPAIKFNQLTSVQRLLYWVVNCKDQKKSYRYTSLEAIILLPTHKEHGYNEYPVKTTFFFDSNVKRLQRVSSHNEQFLFAITIIAPAQQSFSLSKILV